MLLALSAGCSRSPSEATSTEAGQLAGAIEAIDAIPVDESSGADVVVAAFLNSLREGNDQVAEALLTDFAQQAITDHGLKVQPPGSQSSTYKIGEVLPVQGGANVESTWTDYTPAGETVVYDIRWVMRRQTDGWRIVGMSTPADPNGPPIFLNFEDVPDLLAKWEQVDAELAAQAEQPAAIQAERARDAQRR
jgi:hypothetical protein